MKKLALLLALIFPTISSAETTEEKINDFYNRSIACTMIYHYQVKFISISYIVSPSENQIDMLNKINPIADSWVTISSTLENILINDFGYSSQSMQEYRFASVKEIAELVGRDIVDSNARDFTERMFSSHEKCPSLALEIQTYLTNVNKLPEQSESIEQKPKRKM